MKNQNESLALLMGEEGREKHLSIPKIDIRVFNNTPWELPTYATPLSSGFDLRAFIEEPVIIEPGKRHLIPTGIHIELPPMTEAQIRPRSGLAHKKGITVLNTPGTIDADYRGQMHANIINLGDEPFTVNPGDKIAQAVIVPVFQAYWVPVESLEELTKTERGVGGHGHTGI